ncbi:uncharacterized protein LOC105700172 [Orussus abietinus]|uniref:uncharacterized protein LOC105700172 n=1 Tax=Orussus abietinus TaxID=222816 RepID=UPI000625202C|nr:uncharacterized protein LOC105700172 [Orussus abietinus]
MKKKLRDINNDINSFVSTLNPDLYREAREAQQHGQQINYRPYSQAPAQIKQLLQSQLAREPIVHLPAQPPPQLAPSKGAGAPQYQTQAQVSQYKPQVEYASAPQQPAYGPQQPAPAQYTPQYRPASQPAYQQSSNAGQPSQPNYKALYRPVSAPQAAPQSQPQYSSKLPPQLQQLLQFQSELSHPAQQVPQQASQQPGGQSKIYQPNQQRLY